MSESWQLFFLGVAVGAMSLYAVIMVCCWWDSRRLAARDKLDARFAQHHRLLADLRFEWNDGRAAIYQRFNDYKGELNNIRKRVRQLEKEQKQ